MEILYHEEALEMVVCVGMVNLVHLTYPKLSDHIQHHNHYDILLDIKVDLQTK